MEVLKFVKNYALHILVVILAFVLRIFSYAFPSNKFAMDEMYYVPDGYSILKYGYEVTWADSYGTAETGKSIVSHFINSNQTPVSMDWYAMHPPLGKMFIAIGMFFFGGEDPLGWRISAILAGTAVVALTMVLAHILFRQKTITLFAGLFMAVDSLAISMSRIAHLDIFLTLMVLIAFIFTARYIKVFKTSDFILANIAFGLATAVKWSGAYFYIAAMIGILIIHILKKDVSKQWLKILLSPFIFLFSYLVTWSAWFIKYSIPKNGNFFGSVSELINYHVMALGMLSKITDGHNYKSKASEWLLASHPTLMTHTVDDSSNTVSALFTTPNLVFWIASIVAFILVLCLAIFKRGEYIRSGWLLLVGVGAGWLPWLFVGERTVFQYYAVVFQPYLYIILAAVLIYWLKSESLKERKISIARMVILAVILAGLAMSFRLYPSAVGMETPINNSGFAMNSQWLKLNQDLGLYDSSQLPLETIRNSKEG